ncbi:hypothetical protein EJB05_49117, partial [Eragrostis curvula]
MANTEVTKAPPQGPPPARSSRGAAAALRGLLTRAADAVVCCSVGALWMANAACAALIAARRAFGDDSRAAAVARGLFVAMVLLEQSALLIQAWRSRKGDEIGEAGGEATRPAAQGRLPAESTGPRACLNGFCGPVAARVFRVLWVFLAVALVIRMLGPAKGSCAAKVASVLGDIGCFLHAVMDCSIVFTNYVVDRLKRERNTLAS